MAALAEQYSRRHNLLEMDRREETPGSRSVETMRNVLFPKPVLPTIYDTPCFHVSLSQINSSKEKGVASGEVTGLAGPTLALQAAAHCQL